MLPVSWDRRIGGRLNLIYIVLRTKSRNLLNKGSNVFKISVGRFLKQSCAQAQVYVEKMLVQGTMKYRLVEGSMPMANVVSLKKPS
jgi:hypothetical protein